MVLPTKFCRGKCCSHDQSSGIDLGWAGLAKHSMMASTPQHRIIRRSSSPWSKQFPEINAGERVSKRRRRVVPTMVEEPVLPGRAMPSRGRSVEDLPLGSSVVLGDGSAAEEPANAIVQDGLAEEGLSPSAAMLPEVSSDGLAEPEVHGRPTFQSLEKTGDAIAVIQLESSPSKEHRRARSRSRKRRRSTIACPRRVATSRSV